MDAAVPARRVDVERRAIAGVADPRVPRVEDGVPDRPGRQHRMDVEAQVRDVPVGQVDAERRRPLETLRDAAGRDAGKARRALGPQRGLRPEQPAVDVDRPRRLADLLAELRQRDAADRVGQVRRRRLVQRERPRCGDRAERRRRLESLHAEHAAGELERHRRRGDVPAGDAAGAERDVAVEAERLGGRGVAEIVDGDVALDVAGHVAGGRGDGRGHRRIDVRDVAVDVHVEPAIRDPRVQGRRRRDAASGGGAVQHGVRVQRQLGERAALRLHVDGARHRTGDTGILQPGDVERRAEPSQVEVLRAGPWRRSESRRAPARSCRSSRPGRGRPRRSRRRTSSSRRTPAHRAWRGTCPRCRSPGAGGAPAAAGAARRCRRRGRSDRSGRPSPRDRAARSCRAYRSGRRRPGRGPAAA